MKLNYNFAFPIEKFIFILLSFLALLSLGLQHGYPYYFPDTYSYLLWAINKHPNYVRSPIYGAFVVYTSLGFSLWLAISAQALLTMYVLLQALRAFAIRQKEKLLFYLCALLSFSSALSYFVCRIMPDFSTPLVIILLYLILFKTDSFSRFRLVIYSLLFVFLGSLHLSHIAMIPVLTLIVFAIWFKNEIPFKRFVFIFLLWLAIALCNPVANKILKSDEFTLSKTTFSFLTTRLLNHGILKPHLKKRCSQDANYSNLCKYIDILPGIPNRYLWRAKHSDPKLDRKTFDIRHVGGRFDTQGEQKRVFLDAMSQPKNMFLFLFGSALDAGSLFFHIKIQFNESAPQLERLLANHFPLELQKSFQYRQKTKFVFEKISTAQGLLIVICILLLGWGCQRNKFKKSEIEMIYFIVISLIVNAFVLATLAGVFERYQTRVVWMFPFFVLAFLFKNLFEEKSTVPAQSDPS